MTSRSTWETAIRSSCMVNTMCDWNVTLVNTGKEAMTGARVKRIERYVNEDTLMLTYGDGVANKNPSLNLITRQITA